VDLAAADRKNLSKLLERLQKISSSRNLAVHIIFGVSAFDSVTGQWTPTVVPAIAPAQDTRLNEDFTAQFREAELKLSKVYQDLENWLVNTPFPSRPWGGPPMPIAAAELAQRHTLNARFAEEHGNDGREA
jgi:hypothetical protein